MTTHFVNLLSKEVDFDDSMPLKQAHCVEHTHRRGQLWRHHWSRLTVWTHSQLLITHISALHFTLVLCNCSIPQCSQLTGSGHALHAIPSVLTTYGRLWPQPIFPAMQMLCTDKVYRGRRRCWELNAIEADSLTEQVLKRSIFKHVIEAGSLCRTRSSKRLTLMTPLKQTHWPNRFWRGWSSNMPLKQTHLVKQVDNAIVMIFIWIWFRFWFCHCSEVAEGLVLVLLVLNFVF